MSGTLGRLRAALTNNRAALGVLGAVAVAGLAWRARSSKPAASAADEGTKTPTGYYSSGQQVSAATGYDSSASDVYNAIQPQLEELRRMLTGGGTTPIPVPTPAPASGVASATQRPDLIAQARVKLLANKTGLSG